MNIMETNRIIIQPETNFECPLADQQLTRQSENAELTIRIATDNEELLVMSHASIEYHLICLCSGESHGGFISLDGAREYARDEALPAWDIWRGNNLVERHNPINPPAPRWSAPAPLVALTPEPFLSLAERALRVARKRAERDVREQMRELAMNCVLFARAVSRIQDKDR